MSLPRMPLFALGGRTDSDEGAGAGETRAKAIELALTHQIVTKYASLIAIDRTPARAALAPSPKARPEKID